MSLQRQYRLVCDGCGRMETKLGWYGDVRRARADHRRLGWMRYVRQGMQDEDNCDLCPTCAENFEPPLEFKVGRQVAYFPNHTERYNFSHPDVEYGFVVREGPDETSVFCRFWTHKYQGHKVEVSGAKLVKTKNLTRYKSRPQSVVDDLVIFYGEKSHAAGD